MQKNIILTRGHMKWPSDLPSKNNAKEYYFNSGAYEVAIRSPEQKQCKRILF